MAYVEQTKNPDNRGRLGPRRHRPDPRGDGGRSSSASLALLIVSRFLGERGELVKRDRAELAAAAFLRPRLRPRRSRAIVVYIVTDDTQLLGITLGLAFLGVAGALIVAGLRALPGAEGRARSGPSPPTRRREAEVEEEGRARPPAASRGAGLLVGAAGAAGAALGGALVVPFGLARPLRAGRGLRRPALAGRACAWSTTTATPVPADLIDPAGLHHRLPARAPTSASSASPVVVLRLGEGLDDLDRRAAGASRPGASWPSRASAPTRAAPSRSTATPLFPSRPAEAGARVPVPLLDLRRAQGRQGASSARPGATCPSFRCSIDDDGILVAAGPLSDKPGPSYLTVRKT